MVVARVHDVAKPAFEFESDDIRIEQCPCRCVRDLACGEDRRNERAAWMRKRDEAHVVVVECMSGDAVRERSPSWARRGRSAEHSTRAGAFLCGERLRDARRRLDGA